MAKWRCQTATPVNRLTRYFTWTLAHAGDITPHFNIQSDSRNGGVPAMCNIIPAWFFGRPCVKRSVLGYRSVCPVCLVFSVTLVYCGQTVGWIKVKLGMEISLGPGHTVLGGIESSSPKGAQPLPNFRPMSIVTKRSSI